MSLLYKNINERSSVEFRPCMRMSPVAHGYNRESPEFLKIRSLGPNPGTYGNPYLNDVITPPGYCEDQIYKQIQDINYLKSNKKTSQDAKLIKKLVSQDDIKTIERRNRYKEDLEKIKAEKAWNSQNNQASKDNPILMNYANKNSFYLRDKIDKTYHYDSKVKYILPKESSYLGNLNDFKIDKQAYHSPNNKEPNKTLKEPLASSPTLLNFPKKETKIYDCVHDNYKTITPGAFQKEKWSSFYDK